MLFEVFLCVYSVLFASDELSFLWGREEVEYLHRLFYFSLPVNETKHSNNEGLEIKNKKIIIHLKSAHFYQLTKFI